jgi:hypothetical protein
LNRETFKAFLLPDDIGGLTARFSIFSISTKILNEDFCALGSRAEESLVDVLVAALLLRFPKTTPSPIGGLSGLETSWELWSVLGETD